MAETNQQHSQNAPIDNGNHEKALSDSSKPAQQFVISKDSAWVRLTCLFLLCFQNCTAILAIKYNSRLVAEDGLKSLSTVVIVVVELLKVTVCLLYLFVTNDGFEGLFRELKSEIIDKPVESGKLLIPSLLYVAQNNLLFIAVSNLDPGTYQVTSQLKTLITALFAVLILQKKITCFEWSSLLCLVIGCSVVQYDASEHSIRVNENQLLGFVSTLIACVLSGFCGIYIELLLKSSTPKLAVRNIQLGLPGFFLALIVAYVQDQTKIMADGPFQGFTGMTWGVVCLHALGGFLVAAVMTYADNISKCFAMALSLVISSLASVPLFDSRLSVAFAAGSALVVMATMMYSKLPLPTPAAIRAWIGPGPAAGHPEGYKLVPLDPEVGGSEALPERDGAASKPL